MISVWLQIAYIGSPDQATRVDAGQAPKGFLNLAEAIDEFPKFNTPTTASVKGKDGRILYLHLWDNRLT